jgi:hydrogenase maturation protease
MRTLLLGMGNPVLCDDAVGVRLATDLASRLGRQPRLDVIEECSVGGLNLLEVVAGYEQLIVIDSVKTRDGIPGAWYRFSAASLRDTMNLSNVHDANFATALELGRRMGTLVPDNDDIHIFAVEVDDNMTFSETMTPALETAYAELLEEIGSEVKAVLGEGRIRDGTPRGGHDGDDAARLPVMRAEE